MNLENIVLVVAGTGTGLMAGLYYTFDVAIVPALRSIQGAQHIAAMQSINRKILNPVFFLSFFGPALLLPLAALLYWGKPPFGFLVAAAVLYIVGSIGVTAAGNIPLNDKLDKFDANQLSGAEADQIRTDFQRPGSPWMRFHTVRTLTVTAAAALVFIACLFGNTN
jgi:uncharacterized membrane protein